MDDRILTLKEVSNYLRVNKATVYRMAQGGKIPAMKVGKVWRFQQEKIKEWLVTRSNDRALPGHSDPELATSEAR